MITLALVGLVSGVITALSPCVLPVLPAILSTSIQDGARSRRRPVTVVAGLVTSFAVFTLLGGILISSLGIPADALRWTGIAVLAIVGIGLMIPRVGETLQRPFERIRPPQLDRNGNGFVMGLALGLVFVPCAGPILASITVLAATSGPTLGLVVLTAAFSLGIAIPLLAFGLAGQSIFGRIKAVRERLSTIRIVSGAVLLATAVVVATNVAEPLQRIVPTALASIQTSLEDNDAVREELDSLAGRDSAPTGQQLDFDACEEDPTVLQDCGPARDLPGIQEWLNTDAGAPDLEGQVVLLDFWTYSCINCQRTFPYLTQWDERYGDKGLTIVGVHSPEFAFEKVVANVQDAARRYGIEYPIAIDNDFETWREWDQRFWPAHYLIDQTGTVRQVHYGEGAYADTERLIQELLDAPPQPTVEDPDAHTADRTRETYVGWGRGGPAEDYPRDEPHDFGTPATPAQGEIALGGTWTVTREHALAGDDAVLEIGIYAADAHLVLGGEGTVTVTSDADPAFRREIEVSGTPDLRDLWEGVPVEQTLRLEVGPGVEAYAFTFG